ncbi:MAG: XdhC family protein [Desulfobacterales bacterium]|nr:XdhC family protein [Desulfobacterales bacterium]MDD4073097.1 XdhC family protein [Desulfobacterales bacterium]MDD4393097.1 XdhC family protein [Desulfobacterales bacterium]
MIGKALEWIENGRNVALATVIAARGSSPRPVGSQLVIDEKAVFEGSVSGGCIEGAVVAEALEVISDGKSRRVFFCVTQNQAWEVGLACGGEIELFVEKVTWQSDLKRLVDLRAANRPVCLITDLAGGEKTLIPLDVSEAVNALDPEIRRVIEKMQYAERNMIVEAGSRKVFLHGFYPSSKLIIIGAVHIAKHLYQFARTVGYQVFIIDPREAFANTVRFPDVPIHVEWPDEAMEQMKLHQRTAVVTLSHDPKIDDPALVTALRSTAFYIGALGSRKTHAERLQRLRLAGFSDEVLERIHGPVGLDIGAVTPEEIAIAVMGQITAIRRNGCRG